MLEEREGEIAATALARALGTEADRLLRIDIVHALDELAGDVARAAIERAAVGCEVLVEWMAGRLEPAHPFLLDYARLHVGRQYREALIRMIARSSR